MRNPLPRESLAKARHALLLAGRALPFWTSLILAVFAAVLVYRVSAPRSGVCLDELRDAGSGAMMPLPLYLAPDGVSDRVLTLEHRFAVNPAWQRPTLYLGEAAPFYRVQLNVRDLTPGIDLARRDLRDLGPHLYVLPADALVAGENRLLIRMPLANPLGGTRIGAMCIGDHDELDQSYRAGWWRLLGIPRLCLALFIVLALTALALSRLDRGVPSYFWYAGCLLLMACRTGYLAATYMPVTPLAWRAASDLSTVLLVYATYHLMTLFWGVSRHRWSLAWVVVAGVLQLALALDWALAYPWLKLLSWLSICAVAIFFVFDVSTRVRHAPAVERRSMQWVMLFATTCGTLEIVTLNLGTPLRLSGIFVSASAALALMFGFLLIRRALLGTTLLVHATRSFGHALDRALLTPAAPHPGLWQDVSSNIAHTERQQMLLDIQAGFGARLLQVLEQARRDHPESRLGIEIQRALLDLRLMIDALEDTSLSLKGALVTLQQRLQGTLAAAGIASHWQFAAVDAQRIGNRHKLMELFRCLEELLSNVVQHAGARQLRVFAESTATRLVVCIEDDGAGFAQTPTTGRGLRNVQTRMRLLHGSITFGQGAQGRGCRIELSLPRI